MSKSRFRIIALRSITPIGRDEKTLARVRSIQKKVFGANWLYFYKGYKLTDVPGDSDEFGDKPFYGYQLDISQNTENDGMLYDTDNLAVSISAVVGPNGSGKSSAVELMIRILNNLSVAAKGEKKNHLASEHLYFIEDVYGSIVALEDDLYFQIQVNGRSVKIGSYQWDDTSHSYICDHLEELLSLEDQVNRFKPIEGNGIGKLQLYNFFYTVIFNYSMYAFNYQDYFEERTLEDRWTNVSENEAIFYNGEYTEDRVWLKGLFHKNDGYQTPIVLVPMRDKGIINVPKENKLSAERVRNMLFYKNENRKGHGDQPFFPFRIVNGHLEVVALRIKTINDPYFGRKNVIKTLKFEGTPLEANFGKMRDLICQKWAKMMCMAYEEITEHEKLAWDYAVYKTLKIIKTYDKYEETRKDIVYFEVINENQIESRIHSLFQDNSHVTLKLRQALNFLKYNVFREQNEEYISLYDAYKRFSQQLIAFKKMNIKLDVETGELIVTVPEGYTKADIPQLDFNSETGMLSISIPANNNHPIPIFYLDDKGQLIMRYPDEQEIMPPPIFDMTLILIEQNKINKQGKYKQEDLFPMNGLSSGERQIAGVVSNFAYHLANIDSVWEDKNITVLNKSDKSLVTDDKRVLTRYKYVNVVFDEVELYFHPDLQRRFVKHMAEAQNNLNLKHVEGVNVILVTHSPFVLSDLPRTNVLALGDEDKEVNETFCANIHEMLGSSFFMKYTFGDLAREHVEEILCLYNDFAESKDKVNLVEGHKDSWPRYKYVASLIADEYLHGLVGRMINEMESFMPPIEPSDDELDIEIMKTENHLKELKAKKERRI